jgi:hypothetical protein
METQGPLSGHSGGHTITQTQVNSQLGIVLRKLLVIVSHPVHNYSSGSSACDYLPNSYEMKMRFNE